MSELFLNISGPVACLSEVWSSCHGPEQKSHLSQWIYLFHKQFWDAHHMKSEKSIKLCLPSQSVTH